MQVRRTLTPFIQHDLTRKLVLISGPRQVGKTTLARSLDAAAEYLNYDVLRDRRRIARQEWDTTAPLLVLDEIHKMRGWKLWLKGVWDGRNPGLQILVTGSARLDAFRRTGESLAGRFFHHQLDPLSVREVAATLDPGAALARMMVRGGFPEPLLAASDQDAARWRLSHMDSILREDVDAIERVRDIRQLELLVDLLSERVGSRISYQALSEDLSVSPPTVRRWIEVLEALCVVFSVRPYARASHRSLRKEPKVYFYDVARIKDDPGMRLENLTACHLLKRNHFLTSTRGERRGLFYVRDKEWREVDFLTAIGTKPEYLIEVKMSRDEVSRHLAYYADRITCPSFQLVQEPGRRFARGRVTVTALAPWLAALET